MNQGLVKSEGANMILSTLKRAKAENWHGVGASLVVGFFRSFGGSGYMHCRGE